MKVTLSDIMDAIRQIRCEMPRYWIEEFYWGWIETDEHGTPVSLKFKEEQVRVIAEICRSQFRYGRKTPDEHVPVGTMLENLFGLRVLIPVSLEEETR